MEEEQFDLMSTTSAPEADAAPAPEAEAVEELVETPEADAAPAPEAEAVEELVEEEEPNEDLWVDVLDTCNAHRGTINGREFTVYPGRQIVTPEMKEMLQNANLLK